MHLYRWHPLKCTLLTNIEILGTKREISNQEQQATYIRNKVEVALNLPTANPNLPTATSNLSTSLFKNDNSNLTIEINIGKGIVKKCVSTIKDCSVHGDLWKSIRWTCKRQADTQNFHWI